jgi:hypothetical protein
MLGTLEGAPAMRTLLLANCPASLGLGSEYVRHLMYSNCIDRLRHARKRHGTWTKSGGWRLEKVMTTGLGDRIWGRRAVGSYLSPWGLGVMGHVAWR